MTLTVPLAEAKMARPLSLLRSRAWCPDRYPCEMKWVVDWRGQINCPLASGEIELGTLPGEMVALPPLGELAALGATTPGMSNSCPENIGWAESMPLNLVISLTATLYFLEMELSVSFLATAIYTPSTGAIFNF